MSLNLFQPEYTEIARLIESYNTSIGKQKKYFFMWSRTGETLDWDSLKRDPDWRGFYKTGGDEKIAEWNREIAKLRQQLADWTLELDKHFVLDYEPSAREIYEAYRSSMRANDDLIRIRTKTAKELLERIQLLESLPNQYDSHSGYLVVPDYFNYYNELTLVYTQTDWKMLNVAEYRVLSARKPYDPNSWSDLLFKR